MSEQHKQWIGIDVCTDYLDIAIHPEDKTFRLKNQGKRTRFVIIAES